MIPPINPFELTYRRWTAKVLKPSANIKTKEKYKNNRQIKKSSVLFPLEFFLCFFFLFSFSVNYQTSKEMNNE